MNICKSEKISKPPEIPSIRTYVLTLKVGLIAANDGTRAVLVVGAVNKIPLVLSSPALASASASALIFGRETVRVIGADLKHRGFHTSQGSSTHRQMSAFGCLRREPLCLQEIDQRSSCRSPAESPD